MKKFITVITLQVEEPLSKYVYRAQDNSKLQMEEATSFPILSAINGYVTQGEEFEVIALVAENNPAAEKNFRAFCCEIEEICTRKGISCPSGVKQIQVVADQSVSSHIDTFQKLIDCVQDEDELYACMTYGTKPMSTSILLALHYAYKIKQNTSISCVVYGEIERLGQDRSTWNGKIYDMTALVQLNEIVSMLSEHKINNPEKAIRRILEW